MDEAIAILGAGSWGTALAIQAARSRHNVLLWSHKSDVVSAINMDAKNPKYLGDVTLPHNIKATDDITQCAKYKHVLIAVPAQSTRQTLSLLPKKTYSLVVCSKGIELNSLQLMSQVVLEVLPGSITSVLSGPNFAYEIAQGLPGVTSIASYDKNVLDDLTKLFTSTNFKVYPSDDVNGVQICGVIKNVIAIACGISIGSNLGENAKAAIITKGISEMGQLVLALGGKFETVLSPAGIGDLTLTCGSKVSRNMTYGINLALGKIEDSKLAEGLYAAKSISELAKKHNLNLPLIEALARAVESPSSAAQEIEKLFI